MSEQFRNHIEKKIVETMSKSISITHTYMTGHFHGLVQVK